MSDIDDFYNSILNIRLHQNEKTKELIQGITKKAIDEVKKVTPDLEGFCKFLASEIQEKLNQNGIRNYWIDFNELINVDHVVLIAEYRTTIGMQHLLIDPSFQQFTKQENKELIKLKDWPSEKIKDKNMVEDLIKTGVSELDERRWNDYVTGFTDNSQNITLDNLLKGKLKREEQENDRKRK
ncbi:MAG TPA: hypothetical protein IAB35_02735 [Candidatus Faecimonas gallistercoris]|nr:hypothetical protein [Candidatus Faecimonas gallistercoris]